MSSQMLRDMQEQPEALGRLLSEGQPEVERAAEAIRARKVNFVQLAARGSSDNAARYGQYLFGALNGLAAGLGTPSLYTVYGTPPQLERRWYSACRSRANRRTSPKYWKARVERVRLRSRSPITPIHRSDGWLSI